MGTEVNDVTVLLTVAGCLLFSIIMALIGKKMSD